MREQLAASGRVLSILSGSTRRDSAIPDAMAGRSSGEREGMKLILVEARRVCAHPLATPLEGCSYNRTCVP